MPDNNTSWKPDWWGETPRSITYNYPDNSFCIQVDEKGIIFVAKDDWLSKYSMAIHGNFDVEDIFFKYNVDTKDYDFIKNLNLIYEGEILLHFPTHNAWALYNHMHPSPEPDPADPEPEPEPSDPVVPTIEKLPIFEIDTVGWGTDILKWILKRLGKIALANLTQVVGPAMIVFNAMSDIINAQHPHLYAEKFYATIFATVEYAFGPTTHPSKPTYDPEVNPPCGVLDTYKEYIPELPIVLPIPSLSSGDPCFDNNNVQIPNAKFCIANPAAWIELYYENLWNNETDFFIKSSLDFLKDAWEDTVNKKVIDLNSNLDPLGTNAEVFQKQLLTFRYKAGEKKGQEFVVGSKEHYFIMLYAIHYSILKNSFTLKKGKDKILYLPSVHWKIYENYRNAYKNS